MKTKATILIVLFTLLSSAASASAILLVVHPDNELKELSQQEIKKLFLRKASSIRGVRLEPINHSANQSIRVVFDDEVLEKSPSRAKAYWSRMIFTASATPPPELESSTAVIKWVSKHQNAIGYVEEGAHIAGKVKIIKKFEFE